MTFTDTWNAAYQAAPDGSSVDANTLDTIIKSLKVNVKERFTAEHNFDLTDNANQGTHLAGSALAYYQAAAPTTRPSGDTLDSDDAGRLFVDSDIHGTYVYTGSDFIRTGMACKVIEIGDWDMNTTASKNVPHGFADFTVIRSVSCMIREDAGGDTFYPLFGTMTAGSPVANGGCSEINLVNITLYRLTSGVFDGLSFNQTSYNRGWVVIHYEG